MVTAARASLTARAFFFSSPSSQSLDWVAVEAAASAMSLRSYISLVRDAQLCERERQIPFFTLLHYASFHGDMSAVVELLRRGVEPTVMSDAGVTPADLAASAGHAAVLRVLIACGAHVGISGTLLHNALRANQAPCVRAALENGGRLEYVDGVPCLRNVQPWMHELEWGRRHCIDAVRTLLGIRRFRRNRLEQHDKFVIRHIGFCIVATRGADEWQWRSAPSNPLPLPLPSLTAPFRKRTRIVVCLAALECGTTILSHVQRQFTTVVRAAYSRGLGTSG